IPGDGGEPLDDLPTNAEEIRVALLDAFDRQRQIDLAARLVARHLTLGHSVEALIGTLARALLREDAGFPCLPGAGRWGATVWRVGQYRRGQAYPRRCRPLSRCPFADGTRRTANG